MMPANAAYSDRNKIRLIKGGKEYFDCLERMINNASVSIHLQTYIFIYDETGSRIASLLTAAAQRGVAVYVLLDGYGSEQWRARWVKALREQQVQVRWFSPPLRSRYFYFGRRLHHKIIVVDATYSLTGGVNITNRYNDLPGAPAWLDWALYCEGEASETLQSVCIDHWNRSSWPIRKSIEPHPTHALALPPSGCLVRVRRNDWVRGYMQVSRSYLEMFSKAQSHIVMMSSYFLPGRSFRNAMAKARRRGVRIQVITAGKSDVATAKHAERYLYQWMLRNGVEIFEYQPHILHAKISTYDAKWVTVGSYNVNDISTYASIELNVDVLNSKFAKDVETVLHQIMQSNCIPVTEEMFVQYSVWWKIVWQKICYTFIRFIFLLFTFYFRQHKN